MRLRHVHINHVKPQKNDNTHTMMSKVGEIMESIGGTSYDLIRLRLLGIVAYIAALDDSVVSPFIVEEG